MAFSARRVYARQYSQNNIIFADGSEKYHNATMYNACNGGMYFETSQPLSPGTGVFIKVINKFPDDLYSLIRESKLIALICDAENRLPRLIKEYGGMPAEKLIDSINRIRKRLGGQNADKAISAIGANKLDDAVRIVLNYYDRTYRYGLGKRKSVMVYELNIDSRNEEKVADIFVRR